MEIYHGAGKLIHAPGRTAVELGSSHCFQQPDETWILTPKGGLRRNSQCPALSARFQSCAG